jgi:phosphopantothenoylcysteine decarboxylase
MSTATLGPKHVLIGVTGSVATIKLPKLVQELKDSFQQQELEIRVVSTQNGLHFFKASDIAMHAELFTDELEWQSWKRISDPVLHIDLRNWADLILIAPLDANTLGKIANGLCDNLLVSGFKLFRLTLV